MDIIINLNEEEIDLLTNKVIGDKIRLRKKINPLKNSKREDLTDTKKLKTIESEVTHITIHETLEDSNPLKEHNSNQFLFVNPLEVDMPACNGLTDVTDDNNTSTFVTIVNPASETISTKSVQSASTETLDSDIAPVISERFSFQKEIDLEQLFSEDVIGQALIQKSKIKALTNADRDRISDIIVTHCLNKFKKMDHGQFEFLAENLEKLFPTEKKSTYFIPPIKKKDSRRKKSERARGKLVEKYRNKLHLLKSLSSDTINADGDSEDITKSSEISQDAKDSHIILKTNPDLPPADVLEHWRQSFPVRKLRTNSTIEKYLEDWPVLQTQLAYELMSYDFEQIHKTASMPLQEQFDKLFDKIFRSKHGSLNSTDSSIATLLEGEITTDSKNSLKLYLLPSLLPSKGRTRLQNKKHWKPSIAETRDAICVHAKTPGDVEELQKQRVDIMYEKGLTVQPYIILIGPNLGNIISSLVVINSFQYKCSTVLEALDFCFKAYQVLDAKYPFEAEHLWYLMQWAIYNYKSKSDITFPFLNEFF